MTDILSVNDSALIVGLNRSDVEGTIADLRPFLESNRWLSEANHYAADVVDRLSAPPADSTQERDLAQYISASACLHVNDGWSYLGRAMSCLVAGDTHRALHLAYYAELRAAMSLLAASGVGVFNTKHYAIKSLGRVQKFECSKGTHNFSWLALNTWAEQPFSGGLFSSIIRPEGENLATWFHIRGGASALQAQAKSWFLQWGMDLALVTQDRAARNQSSYRPDGIPSTWGSSTQRVLSLVKSVWEVLEPSNSTPFGVMDRYILRLAVEAHYLSVHGKHPSSESAYYVKYVEQIVRNSLPQAAAAELMIGFLLRKEAPKDPIIFDYAKSKPNSSSDDVFGLVSRAVFLLRMATGSVHDLFQNVGFDSGLLSFWWGEIGAVRGLWQAGEPPQYLGDLWADIEVCLDDLATVGELDIGELRSPNERSYGLVGRLSVLASHERVGLWGLCSG